MTEAEKEPTIQIAALVPTYNNAHTLKSVIEGVLEQGLHLVVVDDGSTDGTDAILEEFRGRVVVERHDRNRGKGCALRLGFDRLREQGYTHAISLDADGQHYPEDLPRFVEAIRQEPGALHVGERDMKSIGAPRRSLFGLWFSNFSLRCLGHQRLRDSQAGFRAYPLNELEPLGLRGTRYDLELEVLIRGARAGIPLRAVPIQCSYSPDGGRVSHFRPVRDFCQIGLQVLRLITG